MGELLGDIRVETYRAIRARQRKRLSSYKGKTVLRAGRILKVLSISRRAGVELEDEALGEKFKMRADTFLMRGVKVLDEDWMKKKAPKKPIPERAHGIAVASELSGEAKVLMLYRLKREAKTKEDKEAVEWYINQVKQGGKVKRWPGPQKE